MPDALLEPDRDVLPAPARDSEDPVSAMAALLVGGARLAVALHAERVVRATFLDSLTARLHGARFRVLRTARLADGPFDLRSLMRQVVGPGADGDPAERFYAALTRREADETALALIVDDADRLTDKTLGYLNLLASTTGLTPLPLQFVLAGSDVLWDRLPENGHLARDKAAICVTLPGGTPARTPAPPDRTSPPAPSDAGPETLAPAAVALIEPPRLGRVEPDWLRELPDPVPGAGQVLPEPRQRRTGLIAAGIAAVAAVGLGALYWRNHAVDGAWLDTLREPPAAPKQPVAAAPFAAPVASSRPTGPTESADAPRIVQAAPAPAPMPAPALPAATALPPLPAPEASPVAAPPAAHAAVSTAEAQPTPQQTTAPSPPAAAPSPASVATTTPPAIVTPPPPVPPAAPPASQPLSPAIVATLIARGQTLLTSGDVTAARQMFERAAAADSPQAAVALGMTYDPRFLAQIRAQGLVPDPQRAAYWYRRAAALGSPDASALLTQLDGAPGN